MLNKNLLRKAVLSSLLLVLIIIAVFLYINNKDKKNLNNSTNLEPSSQISSNNIDNETDDTTVKKELDIKSADSQYVLVNKVYGIEPESYKPSDLVIPSVQVSASDSNEEKSVRELIRPSLEKMMSDAKDNNLDLVMNSGFRSYKSQGFYFNNYVKQYGITEAKKFSAEPGHSEHQTGLAFDLSYKDRKCYLEVCFGRTPAGIWLEQNAHKYGFILRYPEGKTEVTGYQYEPWHFRYVGLEVAKEIYTNKLTYEEYLKNIGLL